jgi:hypothetical protein
MASAVAILLFFALVAAVAARRGAGSMGKEVPT